MAKVPSKLAEGNFLHGLISLDDNKASRFRCAMPRSSTVDIERVVLQALDPFDKCPCGRSILAVRFASYVYRKNLGVNPLLADDICRGGFPRLNSLPLSRLH